MERDCPSSARRIAAELAKVFDVGRAEGLGRRGVGRAEVACAAGAMGVGGVAEVADEGGHAALLGFGEGDHAVDLGAAEGDLGVVAGAPGLGTQGFGGGCGADVAGEVDGCGSLGDELLDGFVEGGEVHLEALGERLGHEVVVGEDLSDAGEVGGGRVVAVEEEVVHLAVGEAVEQDGAGGQAVAAGAADLLVEGFDGCGQGGVDDGADIGFVDAHAEGDGGDDDFELAGLEAALDALADGGFEAGVVGGGREVMVEFGGEFFGGLAGGGVDDGGAGGCVAEEFGGELVAARLGHLDDFDGEVGAAEAVDEECGIV